MSVLPNTREEQIAFFEARLDLWTLNAAALNLAPADLVVFTSQVTAARDALSALETIRANARSATVAFENAWAAMIGPGRDYIRTIKAYAEMTNNPDVYVKSDVPPPKPRGKAPPPALPANFSVALDQNGYLSLRWKCNNLGAQGTTYLVERRLNSAGNYALLGTVGAEKEFLDKTVPAGTMQADYRITGKRAGITGPSAVWTVRLGAADGAGGGGDVLSITPQAESGKLAA